MPQKRTSLHGEKKEKMEPVKITQDDKHKKVTLYLSLDHIFALDRVRTKRLREGAELGDVDKSKLIREAIDLLVKKEKV